MNNHVLSFPFVLLSLITAGFYQLSLLGAVGYGDALPSPKFQLLLSRVRTSKHVRTTKSFGSSWLKALILLFSLSSGLYYLVLKSLKESYKASAGWGNSRCGGLVETSRSLLLLLSLEGLASESCSE